ncbi:VOC family protein [Streptomyces botrytidirepellens]|uniref:VOC family protein n=1 Tax=Streptomyces botrytidirepellens TaxID=2486417 RepID=UPI00319E1046
MAGRNDDGTAHGVFHKDLGEINLSELDLNVREATPPTHGAPVSPTATATARIALVVLYTDHLEESREFYTALGLPFVREQHGSGPVHYSTTLADGMVIELYPATAKRPASSARLGFTIDGQTLTPPLTSGRHVVKDPDGRMVELYAACSTKCSSTSPTIRQPRS